MERNECLPVEIVLDLLEGKKEALYQSRKVDAKKFFCCFIFQKWTWATFLFLLFFQK